MTKQEFIEKFTEIIEDEFYDWITINVEMPNLPELELISNPRENFELKLEYYKNAYDDNMCLKTFSEIKIIAVEGY